MLGPAPLTHHLFPAANSPGSPPSGPGRWEPQRPDTWTRGAGAQQRQGPQRTTLTRAGSVPASDPDWTVLPTLFSSGIMIGRFFTLRRSDWAIFEQFYCRGSWLEGLPRPASLCPWLDNSPARPSASDFSRPLTDWVTRLRGTIY